MKIYIKIILISISCIVFFTVIGYLFKSVAFLSFLGLLITSICFIIFSATQKITDLVLKLKFLKTKNHNGFFENKTINIALFVRGIFLSLGIWTANFYFSLMEFDITKLVNDFSLDLYLSLVGSFVTIIDSSCGGSIQKQSIFTKISTTVGYFSFFKNITMLYISILGHTQYQAMKSLFSSPLWFLDDHTIYNVLIIFRTQNPLFILFLLSVISIFGILILLDGKPIKGLEDDSTYIRVGGLFFFLWLLSAPAYLVYLIVMKYMK